MTKVPVDNMTVEQLVEKFKSIAIDQARAIDYSENVKFNRLYDQLVEVEIELKRRAGDERRALQPFLSEPNPQLRLKAAVALLKLEPSKARATLQGLVDNKEYPQAANARGMLMALAEGRYIPE